MFAFLTVLCSLAGPPLTEQTQISALLEHGVTVALGAALAADVRNTRFEAGWVSGCVFKK